jgi:hypothetical protein
MEVIALLYSTIWMYRDACATPSFICAMSRAIEIFQLASAIGKAKCRGGLWLENDGPGAGVHSSPTCGTATGPVLWFKSLPPIPFPRVPP